MTSAFPPTVDILALSRAEPQRAFEMLGSGQEGLGPQAAADRLRALGPNALPEPRRPGLAYGVWLQVINIFNVLLVVAAALSFVLGAALSDPTSTQMGLVILAIVGFNIGFNLLQERRAAKVVDALRRLIPANTKVTRAGRVVLLPASELVPGDLFTLEEGDRVPADARVLSAFSLTVDQSILSGETAPRECTAEATGGDGPKEPAECLNLLLAGTTIASGSGSAIVAATGGATVFGRIVATTREIAPEPSPLQVELSRTGKLNMAAAVVVGVVLLFVAFALRHLPTVDGVLFMIAVIIDLVPEGLQITVTLALAIASLSMARRNVVVKRLSSVETLGSATVICSDKTGTITTGQMTVRKVWLGGNLLDVTGRGFDPEGRILDGGRRVMAADRADLRRLLEIAALDNSATLTPPVDRRAHRWTAVGDTTDAALLAFALKGGVARKEALTERPRVGLLPFDSRRKMMTSVHTGPDGRLTAFSKGAAQAVLARSTHELNGEVARPMDEPRRAEIMKDVDAMASQAFRVLALAFRDLPGTLSPLTPESVEEGLTFVGLAAIYDPPRADVAEAVLSARSAGIKVIMITGDHELTAAAIARRVGIVTSESARVIPGPELGKMDDAQLSAALESAEVVFARTSPEQKHRVVKALRAGGEIVAVTGDGVNDVPALTEADIGIAMGITGTDVAREAAAMVLLDDNFATIVAGVELGRGVFDNLKGFVTYVFTHNWAELMSFLAFVFLGVPAAIGVLQVLAIDVVMEIPMSLALTSEPPVPAAMARAPRGHRERLFDVRALLVSAYIGVPVGIAAMFAGFAVWARGGWTFGNSAVADSGAFASGVAAVMAGIMFGQVGNLFARRSQRATSWSLELRRNRWLAPGLLGTFVILLVIVYVPTVGAVVSTGALLPSDWALVALIAPMVVALEEARKAVARKWFPIPAVEPPKFTPAIGMEVGLLADAAVGPHPGRPAGPPIVLAIFGEAAFGAGAEVAMRAAANRNSRLIMLRIRPPGEVADAVEGEMERRAAELGVVLEQAEVRIPQGPTFPKEAGEALRRASERAGASLVVADAVEHEVLRRLPAWLEHAFPARVLLVGQGEGAKGALSAAPRRILVPVLRAFNAAPFEVAADLTAGHVVPEVDVVAARVVRIPPSVPLYSTYRAETLVDERKEMSFMAALRRRPLSRILTPKLLLVRDVGRDIADFAAERRTDLIVVHVGPRARKKRRLAREERDIVRASACPVGVLLTPD